MCAWKRGGMSGPWPSKAFPGMGPAVVVLLLGVVVLLLLLLPLLRDVAKVAGGVRAVQDDGKRVSGELVGSGEGVDKLEVVRGARVGALERVHGPRVVVGARAAPCGGRDVSARRGRRAGVATGLVGEPRQKKVGGAQSGGGRRVGVASSRGSACGGDCIEQRSKQGRGRL